MKTVKELRAALEAAKADLAALLADKKPEAAMAAEAVDAALDALWVGILDAHALEFAKNHKRR